MPSPYPLRLESLLARARAHFPAVELSSRRSSGSLRRSNYAEVAARAQALAIGLQAAGLKSGERVATLMWNHLEHLEAYFGVPMAGGIVHPLNPRLGRDELAAIVDHAADAYLIVEEDLLPLAERIWPGPPDRRWVMRNLNATVASDEGDGYEPWIQRCLQAPGHAEAAREPGDENAPAFLAYTSGTTGDPKGVVYTHRTLVLHAMAIALPDVLNLSARDRILQAVPMFHACAWGLPYAATLVGATQVFPGTHPSADTLLELLESERISFSAGVAALWQEVLKGALERQRERSARFEGLRVNLGGMPASPALFQAFDAAGIAVHMGWGMTELAPVGAMNPLAGLSSAGDDDRTRPGLPLPLIEIRALNERGEEVPWDDRTPGELEVRGPWVAREYWNQAEQPRPKSGHAPPPDSPFQAAGWFRTGDIVCIDSRGAIRIVDRAKDLIRSGGEWISSAALESALLSHPSVREAAVIGVPHPRWQERPLAIVVPANGAQLDPEALRRHLGQHFAHWQCPDRWIAVAELPRSGTGKLDKRRLREAFGKAAE